MGWVNYVVLKGNKALIIVNRSIELDEFFIKKVKTFKNLLEELNYDDFVEQKLINLNISTFSKITNVAEIAYLLFSEELDNFLLAWLILHNIDFEVISEFEYEKRKEEFKDYKIVDLLEEEERENE